MNLCGEFDAPVAAAKPLKHRFIIDAGGYIGTAAITFAKAFPDATIVSIEPSRENHALLARNTAAYPNIVALNIALGAQPGSTWLRDRGKGGVGFTTIAAPLDCPSALLLHEVDVVTVPDLMRRFRVQGVDLLKLDVEGAEYDLLKDRPAWIDEIRVIFAELHDRIVPGCETAFDSATAGRRNIADPRGEKILSVLA
jgi:FkbM family methyltransferase